MTRLNLGLITVGLLTLRLIVGAAPAPSASSPAEETLTSKGLTRIGIIYELDDDAHLQAGLRTMYSLKAKIEDNTRKRQTVDNAIANAEQKITQLNEQERQLGDKIAQTPHNQLNYNDMVVTLNNIQSNIRDGYKYIDDRKKDRAKIVDPTDDFISATQDRAAKMEAASKQYAVLANDPAVTGALAQINQSAVPKVKLGPSAAFTKALSGVRRERDAINSSVIQCDTTNGVAMVDVMFNDSVTEKAIVDSGASSVSVPASLAHKLGLKPSKEDTPVQMRIANGQTVTAHAMMLKSVRVGQFRVENVECVVMPDKGGNADILLGGTFLKNFVYRMDLTTGQLHLAEIAKSPDASKDPVWSATTSPSSPQAPREKSKSTDQKASEKSPDDQTPAAPVAPPVAKSVDVPTTPQKLACHGGQSVIAAQNSMPERNKAVTLRASDDGDDEVWTIKSNGDGTVQFINKKATMAMSSGGRTATGIKMYFWPVNANDSQLWILEPAAGGEHMFKVTNKASKLCMTAHPNGTVTQEQWQDSDDQKWQFEPAEK